MKLKEVKKVLMTGKGSITLSNHTNRRLIKRGYLKGDIVAAIFNGEIVEYQTATKVSIAGNDMDHNPIILVMEKKAPDSFHVITVMPPLDHKRFKECI